MFCSHCGSSLAGAQGQFCPKCGAKSANKYPLLPASISDAISGKAKPIAIGLAAVVIVVILIVVFSGGGIPNGVYEVGGYYGGYTVIIKGNKMTIEEDSWYGTDIETFTYSVNGDKLKATNKNGRVETVSFRKIDRNTFIIDGDKMVRVR